MTSDHAVRLFRPGDRDGFLALHRTVLGGDPTEAWFDWKYGANPFADDIPIHVVEHGGELIGARPSFVLEFTTERESLVGVQLSDLVVHPDHQRRGVHTALARAGMRFAADRGVDFLFGFPNRKSYPNAIRFGYTEVARLPVAVRFDGAPVPEGLPRALGAAVRPLWRVCASLRDRNPRPEAAGISVRRFDACPVRQLCSLEETHPSDGLRVRRDRRFHEWRYRRPGSEYEFHVARADGEPRAAVVARVSENGDRSRVDLVDVLPGDGSADPALERLFFEIVERHGDARKIRTLAADPLGPVLDRYRFWRKDAFPVSVLAPPSQPLVVYPLDESRAEWLTDWENWDLSLVEWDIQ